MTSDLDRITGTYSGRADYCACGACGCVWDIDRHAADPTECPRCLESAVWRFHDRPTAIGFAERTRDE